MKPSLLKVAATIAAALTLGACAANQPRPEPHHYSKDRDGNRVACYATDRVNEYDCVPVAVRYRYPYAYDPLFYDPFWPYGSVGFWYGPRYYVNSVYVAPRPAAPPPTPPPRLPPPHHWRHRG